MRGNRLNAQPAFLWQVNEEHGRLEKCLKLPLASLQALTMQGTACSKKPLMEHQLMLQFKER